MSFFFFFFFFWTSPSLPSQCINTALLMLGVVKTFRDSHPALLAALYTVSAGIKVYCLNLLFDFHPRRQHIIPGWDSVYNAPPPGCSAINMGESKAAPSVRRA